MELRHEEPALFRPPGVAGWHPAQWAVPPLGSHLPISILKKLVNVRHQHHGICVGGHRPLQKFARVRPHIPPGSDHPHQRDAAGDPALRPHKKTTHVISVHAFTVTQARRVHKVHCAELFIALWVQLKGHLIGAALGAQPSPQVVQTVYLLQQGAFPNVRRATDHQQSRPGESKPLQPQKLAYVFHRNCYVIFVQLWHERHDLLQGSRRKIVELRHTLLGARRKRQFEGRLDFRFALQQTPCQGDQSHELGKNEHALCGPSLQISLSRWHQRLERLDWIVLQEVDKPLHLSDGFELQGQHLTPSDGHSLLLRLLNFGDAPRALPLHGWRVHA
mmetsp:Transcript_52813/g.140994  ORF Transcript_52813/g.140994 Transcript_52813/m.140994 type:complete len:332 (+) Transcript_52813:706-1701(+)